MLTKKETPKNKVEDATPTNKTPNQSSKATLEKNSTTYAQSPTYKTGKNTSAKVTIKYDVGFGNNLYIRGQGADLSWSKGIALKNTRANEWEWETTSTFTKCEFKILINDENYETGPNHIITYGSTVQYTPHFSHR
jgi:hypothetical protein